MKKIKVTSRDLAVKLANNDFAHIDRIISISSSGSESPCSFVSPGRVVLLLQFDDTSFIPANASAKFIRENNIILPDVKHVRKIIDNAEPMLSGNGTLLIHCDAGLSRSPAVAYILSCLDHGPGMEIMALKVTLDACENPNDVEFNKDIVDLGDKLLGSDYRLSEALNAYRVNMGMQI